jgi:hypothetical protein
MLSNTKLFLEARENFQRDGVYTKATPETKSFNDFWASEWDKCINGVTIGNTKVTGCHYYYLNYCQIEMKDPYSNRKIISFPLFTDVDWEFFTHYDRARIEGKGVILVKPRRTGFSWKLSAMASHEFNFFRSSSVAISAFEDKYSSNTFNMAKQQLNFLANTEWYKLKNPDTNEFVQARHLKKVDGVERWVGFMSKIKKITFKDNPFASAGGSYSLFIFDEAGIFPNIKESYNISEPTWRDGEDVIGTPIILGTGGDMSGNTAAFAEMFYSPDEYNLLSFDNIWDDNKTGTKCGWFIPSYRQRFGSYYDKTLKKKIPLIDADGNSNEYYSRKAVEEEREIKGVDPISRKNHTTQYPFSPSDAFLISSGNKFPALLLKEQKAIVEANYEKYIASNLTGVLEFGDNMILEFKHSDKLTPIRKFPIKTEERFGCIEIFELPQKNSDDEIFKQRYIAGIDPYDDDDAPSSVSLGSMFIFDRYLEKIVAEYTERPEKASDFYENCRRLLLFYNAIALPETNKLGIVTYFEQKKSLFLLAETPVQLRNRTDWKPNLNTSYGFKATKQTNDLGDLLINQWLKSQAPQSQNPETLNTHLIFSLGLLDELIKYNPDPKANFDRISSLRSVLIFHETMNKGSGFLSSKNTESNYQDQWIRYWGAVHKQPVQDLEIDLDRKPLDIELYYKKLFGK